jgi:hypothetical protein
MFTTDQVLTVLVNFSHSLSPETKEVFDLANDDLVYRLDANFNAVSREAYIQPEDFPKIFNTLLDHKQMSHELKQTTIDYIKENEHYFSYKILAELAVIYASKMDPKYKDLFFKRSFKEKFLKDLKHLDSDSFYKIFWSMMKADAIAKDEMGDIEWS